MALPDLFIPKSNPLHFVIETGTGTIMEGETIDGNFFDPPNCFKVTDYVQCWQCGDVLNLQFYMLAETDGGKFPYLIIHDEIGTVFLVNSWVQMDQGNGVYIASITLDSDDFFCGRCLTIDLWSALFAIPAVNIYTSNNDGDFEAGLLTFSGAGLAYERSVASTSVAEAHSPTHSMLITAHATPGTSSKYLAVDTVAVTLSSGSVYKISLWVYHPSVNGILATGAGLSIFVLAPSSASTLGNPGWPDALIIDSVSFTEGTDPDDEWVQLSGTFKVNSDLTGSIVLYTDVVPNASGLLYVDDIVIEEASVALEATSNDFEVQDTGNECPCTTYVTYGAITGQEHSQMGLKYAQALSVNQYHIRLPFDWQQFKISDSEFIKNSNSAGKWSLIRSVLTKMYSCKTAIVPFWMIEKIHMIMKHDYLLFDGLQVLANTGEFSIEWNDHKTMNGSVSFEVVSQNYNYQNANCGQE